jgi:hypothetical protein
MGNNRGNIYSLEHVYLDPTDPLFWDFSWYGRFSSILHARGQRVAHRYRPQ